MDLQALSRFANKKVSSPSLALVGTIVGAFAVFLLLAGLEYIFCRRRAKAERSRATRSAAEARDYQYSFADVKEFQLPALLPTIVVTEILFEDARLKGGNYVCEDFADAV